MAGKEAEESLDTGLKSQGGQAVAVRHKSFLKESLVNIDLICPKKNVSWSVIGCLKIEESMRKVSFTKYLLLCCSLDKNLINTQSRY